MNSTGITCSESSAAAARKRSKLRSRDGSTRAGVGMNASQSRCVRTVRCPADLMARSSASVRATSYSCQMYGPTSRDQ